jgi:hypothetical protein
MRKVVPLLTNIVGPHPQDSAELLPSTLTVTGIDGATDVNTYTVAEYNAIGKPNTQTIGKATQAALNTKVDSSGDVMTGNLMLSGDPTLPLQAATKEYVDNSVSNIVKNQNFNVDGGKY